MPADSTILSCDSDRNDAFVYIACMCLDNYVDWETGQCNFDNENFRSLIEFVRSFPEKTPFHQIEPTDYNAMLEANRESLERFVESAGIEANASCRSFRVQLFLSPTILSAPARVLIHTAGKAISFHQIEPTDYNAMLEANRESLERFYGGQQMLEQEMIGRLQDVQRLPTILSAPARVLIHTAGKAI